MKIMKKFALVTATTILATALTGCNDTNKDAEPNATDPANQTTAEQTPTDPTTTDMAQAEFISIDDAIATALNNTMGDVMSVEFDSHNNGTRADYEVDIIANNLKHDIKIDAATANIINVTQKSLDAEDQAEYQALQQALQQAQVTLEQAIKVAIDSLPNAVVTEASFELENGQSIYEINLFANHQKHDVIVDANSGNILNTKLD